MNKVISSFALFLVMINLSAKTMSYSEVYDIALDTVENHFSYIDNLDFKDTESFCPNFETLSANEKHRFFAHLITNISFFESGFKVNTSFNENSGVKSKGLVGLSFGATQQGVYQKNGCHVINESKDILVPSKSLRCGMAIIETWIRRDGYLSHQYKNSGKNVYRGSARYWSTLRRPYKVTLKNYNNQVVTVGKKDKVIKRLKNNFSECF